MTEPAQPVAIFDFDHTLIRDDSLWPFLVFAAGWLRAGLALAAVAGAYAWRFFWNRNDPVLADRRTFFKAHLLMRLLAGRRAESLGEALARLCRWRRWNEPMRRALQEHYDEGHHILVASGSLDLYLPELLRDVPYHGLVCTEVGVRKGIVTGAMPEGNCVRQRKAERVADYLEAHGPFGESWAYGNFPDDLPMLNLAKHRVIA
jgi:phosphatidylglycerophosphatase C